VRATGDNGHAQAASEDRESEDDPPSQFLSLTIGRRSHSFEHTAAIARRHCS
jgi:hypothetical protein